MTRCVRDVDRNANEPPCTHLGKAATSRRTRYAFDLAANHKDFERVKGREVHLTMQSETKFRIKLFLNMQIGGFEVA